MKLARPLSTSVGAVVLTLVAAGTALAVNIGIMSHSNDPGAGALDTVATASATPPQPNTRYVTIYVNDPSNGLAVVDTADPAQITAEPAIAAATVAGSDADGHTGEHEYYEGADDDD